MDPEAVAKQIEDLESQLSKLRASQDDEKTEKPGREKTRANKGAEHTMTATGKIGGTQPGCFLFLSLCVHIVPSFYQPFFSLCLLGAFKSEVEPEFLKTR